jgi:hypothetical protein
MGRQGRLPYTFIPISTNGNLPADGSGILRPRRGFRFPKLLQLQGVGDLRQVLVVWVFLIRPVEEQEQQAHNDARRHASQEKDNRIDSRVHGFSSLPFTLAGSLGQQFQPCNEGNPKYEREISKNWFGYPYGEDLFW